MSITSDAIYGRKSEPYDSPRGTCPRCDSGDVRHLVAGMRGTPEWAMDNTPEWVDGVGCVLPPHDRECDGCGLEWIAEDDQL